MFFSSGNVGQFVFAIEFVKAGNSVFINGFSHVENLETFLHKFFNER